MKFSYKRVLFLALFSVAATNAQSATVVCSGTVDTIGYHQAGQLMVKLSSMNTPVSICSIDHNWVVAGSPAGDTSVEACKHLHADFLSAKIMAKAMSDVYFDGAVPGQCNQFSVWSQATVRYYIF